MQPAAIRSDGTWRAIIARLSMPFWSVTSRVRSPINGARRFAAASVSKSLTVKITTSTGPTVDGSSVAATLVQVRVAVWALDAQSRVADRAEMRAAGDEMHLLADLGEPSADVAAHATGAHDRDLHDRSSRAQRPQCR